MSGAAYLTQAATSAAPSTDVSIAVGGMSLAGWTRIRITRGCERVPADFELEVTEHYPGLPTDIVIQPGVPCTVMIGQDPIIMGYVDRYASNLTPTSHQISIVGRSKCADLVDCSAVVPSSQVGNCSPISLAQALAKPFSISVVGNVATPQLPPFSVTLGETPFEIIEKVARYAARLVYDDPNGNLVMEQVGTQQHQSGFAEGVNCQAWGVVYSMDERHSDYIACLFSMQNLQEFGNSGNLLGVAKDAGVPRYRPLIIVSEQFVLQQSLALQRAKWEAQRRRGRSQALTLTCDSWHDSAGVLWTPNTLAPITFPSVKLPQGTVWLITEVSYILDPTEGTIAEVTLMPKEALTPEPTDLQAYDWQVQQALTSTGSGTPTGTTS